MSKQTSFWLRFKLNEEKGVQELASRKTVKSSASLDSDILEYSALLSFQTTQIGTHVARLLMVK